MSTTNRRCSLRAKSRDANFVFGEKTESNVMYPLALRERLVFPYTPTVQSGSTAEYDEYSFTQSAYKYPSYVKLEFILNILLKIKRAIFENKCGI